MTHMPHDFGRSDVDRRRVFEQRHNGAPIEPLYPQVQQAPLRIWIITGILVAAFVVWAVLS